MRRLLWLALIPAAVLAWKFGAQLIEKKGLPSPVQRSRAVAVEAEGTAKGTITLRRSFSGALEAGERFVVAPKVSGRVETLAVDIGDRVRQGQVVVRLDHEEYSQAVTQAEADLAVARANLIRAESDFDIAVRELERVRTLRKRGVSSESQLDAALSKQLSTRSGGNIAQAQVTRAQSALETARIRLGYTKVTADWSGDDPLRIVAENFVAEGDTVSANTPLMSIVDLDPEICVIHVTEKDYGRLAVGLSADLTCDAFPGRLFSARISRIAPVFSEASRQARVELSVDNGEGLLKPGMFVTADLALATVQDAVMVPDTAVTVRDGKTGVFLIRETDLTVEWVPVATGIREGRRVQVEGLTFPGRVVTLGQQMLADGTKVVIPEDTERK